MYDFIKSVEKQLKAIQNQLNSLAQQGNISVEEEKILYSKKEARKYLGNISDPSLYRLMRDQKITYIKRGKLIFFRKEHLDEYLLSNTIGAKNN